MPPRAFMPLALAAQCRGWADGGRISRGGRAPRSVPAMNQTFVMCKPDAVERGLVGEIVARLERKGLTLVAAELRTADTALARSEENTSELQSLMRNSYAVFCLKKKNKLIITPITNIYQ